MASLRTSSAIFILFCSVIHSAMAYGVYYGSWYLYIWIPLLIIAIIRCCCYMNRKKEPEVRTVYVEGGPTGPPGQTVVNTQMTAGSTVVNPPQYQHAPLYGQPQGALINSAYTPDPAGTAYPPNAAGLAYPPSSPGQVYPPTAYPPPSAAYPPPPQYSEAIKLPEPL